MLGSDYLQPMLGCDQLRMKLLLVKLKWVGLAVWAFFQPFILSELKFAIQINQLVYIFLKLPPLILAVMLNRKGVDDLALAHGEHLVNRPENPLIGLELKAKLTADVVD